MRKSPQERERESEISSEKEKDLLRSLGCKTKNKENKKV